MRDGCHAFRTGEAGGVRAGPKCGIGRLCRSPARLNIPNPSSFAVTRCCRAATAPSFPAAMIVQVLGCSGSIAAGCRTTSFLLDDDVLIDAGTGVGDMPLDALARIEHILISHSHLDHILSIGLLADSVMRERSAARGRSRSTRCPRRWRRCARTSSTASSGPTSRACRAPSTRCSRWCRSPSAKSLELNGKRIEVLDASHTVPAVGFAVDGGTAGWWVYTGDTGPNPALWERLARMKVAHLVIETAFRRRRAPARPHQPPPLPRRARPRAAAPGAAASTSTSPTSSRASAPR